MIQREHRGVSLGTLFMLTITLAVLAGCGIVLPRLMGSADILMDESGMQSSANLNDSLPELTLSEIPLTLATQTPEITIVPAITPAPTAAVSQPPTASPTPALTGTVSLTFGGSINMDDLTRKSGYYSDSEKYDFTDNLSLLAGEMDSDLTMVTLESITDASGNVRQIPNAPPEIMEMLASAHVDMVALGYNRAFDRGLEGLQATVKEASERGLTTLGAYASQEDAQTLRIVEIDRVQVAFLHYATQISSAGRTRLNRADAAYALPVASVSDAGAELIAQDIFRAREQGAHIVVVSINWSGQESVSTSSAKLKGFIQKLSDAGADVVVGAGTKALREVSWFMSKREDGSTRQTLCAWSLGSLLNGERGNGNVAGMLLHVQMSIKGDAISFERVSYTPTYIWRFKQDNYWRYRVIACDLPAPEGMDEDQATYAERAFENIKKTLGTSPVTLRIK